MGNIEKVNNDKKTSLDVSRETSRRVFKFLELLSKKIRVEYFCKKLERISYVLHATLSPNSLRS